MTESLPHLATTRVYHDLLLQAEPAEGDRRQEARRRAIRLLDGRLNRLYHETLKAMVPGDEVRPATLRLLWSLQVRFVALVFFLAHARILHDAGVTSLHFVAQCSLRMDALVLPESAQSHSSRSRAEAHHSEGA